MQDYPGAGEVALPRVTMFLYLTDTRNSAIRLLPGSHTVTTPPILADIICVASL